MRLTLVAAVMSLVARVGAASFQPLPTLLSRRETSRIAIDGRRRRTRLRNDHHHSNPTRPQELEPRDRDASS